MQKLHGTQASRVATVRNEKFFFFKDNSFFQAERRTFEDLNLTHRTRKPLG
jgi:hypothetical protein